MTGLTGRLKQLTGKYIAKLRTPKKHVGHTMSNCATNCYQQARLLVNMVKDYQIIAHYARLPMKTFIIHHDVLGVRRRWNLLENNVTNWTRHPWIWKTLRVTTTPLFENRTLLDGHTYSKAASQTSEQSFNNTITTGFHRSKVVTARHGRGRF